ncbi:SusE domain-containing protein [Flavobacterium sp.]|uniref:SusE domain-containing protein n=2 Tax=Flavobacterium sp. TaxID=239 RepID=UPI004048366E
MSLYIKKITSLLLLSLVFIFTACDDEESLEIKTPDAAFVLQEPGINNVFLNFGLPQNSAFTVTWNDNLTGASSYGVEMSLNAEFTNVVNLGNSNSNTFSISVEDLNTAIHDAGATTFRDIAIYLRVNSGSVLSNSVLFLVTTYPTDPAVFTSPAANDSFVLSIGSTSSVAITTTWTDAVLGSNLDIDVSYTIEAALSGSGFTSPVAVGSVENLTTLTSTHGDFNSVALGIGLVAGVAGDMDLRIVARTTNENGSVLERISNPLTISVTPFSVVFPNLYFVGNATSSDWNNNNNNTPVFRNQNVPNNYVYTGYFGAGAFKMLEVKGQWAPQWGTNDGSTLAVNPGGGSDPGTFNVSTAGYYTYNFTTVGQSGTFTVAPYDASAAPVYTSMGIIGAAIGGWGDSDEVNFTQDANNPHLWYALGVVFTSGNEFLIRADDAWANVWRYNGSQNQYGTAILAGTGSNFPFTEASGNYDVWFNDLDGKYIIIPQ